MSERGLLGDMEKITSFRVEGLFRDRDVSIPIKDNNLVLVGPNGVGKSSVATIFYYFVSRQWTRLLNFEFSAITADIGGETLTIHRDEISGLSDFKRVSSEFPIHSRVRFNVQRLIDAGEAEKFFSLEKMTLAQRKQFAELLEMPIQEVSYFQRNLFRRLGSMSGDLFATPRLNLERRLSNLLPGRVLYLPTYRRIEKDIKDIFPDFEARYRAQLGEDGEIRAGRTAGHYIELVSFGMEDVRANISNKMGELRDYSLSQYNDLSGIYLRDVIHGRADKFVARDINNLTESDVDDVLGRVSEETLSAEDKSLLREKIQSIKDKKNAVDVNDRYLAHYFTQLLAANADIRKREQDIASFVDVCNGYLHPSKHIEYNERNFSVVIYDESERPIDLSVLSSGEKQIVSIFAHLYLEDIQDQFVVIDEPELSLSVPWQKRFLPDIKATGRCGFLLAVTHSPFIYENDLRKYSKDLRLVTTFQEKN
jgi:ABC-type Mn2+/Zn2+ transport system ATPase subunit